MSLSHVGVRCVCDTPELLEAKLVSILLSFRLALRDQSPGIGAMVCFPPRRVQHPCPRLVAEPSLVNLLAQSFNLKPQEL
jgi:hypothetical protein